MREAEGTRVPVTHHLRDTSALQALEIGVRGSSTPSAFEACDETVAAQVVRRIVERGAYLVPTLAITEQITRFGSPEQEAMALAGRDSGARRQYWRRDGRRRLAPTEAAGAGGGSHASSQWWRGCRAPEGRWWRGSDTSNPYVVPGASLHRELELLVEAGLSPREALAAATPNRGGVSRPGTDARHAGGRQDSRSHRAGRGSRRIGSRAIRQIEVVIRDGRVVWKR